MNTSSWMYANQTLEKSWDDQTKLLVWQKGTAVDNFDSARFRKDQCGAWMSFSDYGNRDSKFGWEVDHITPVSDGGSDALSNLRPLQWKNNASKSDGRLYCKVVSMDKTNIER